MKDLSQVPRKAFAYLDTPLEPAPRLSQALGCQLFFKRDDCTGLAGGGNKARKLEYLLADAEQQGADTLVTIGGIQSNHARQTAAAAAKFGFGCELVLEAVQGAPKTDYNDNGNLLLDRLLGARIHRMEVGEDSANYAEALMNKLKNRGRKPYLIPVGGSNALGSLGYVRCANEILGQMESQGLRFDQIVIASGSGGTQAGLLAGLIAADTDIPVLGISVSRSSEEQRERVEALLRETLTSLGMDPKRAEGRVITNGDYYGEGYGISTESMVQAVKQCASLEGILLDPVYTGKAMAAMFDLCARGDIAAGSRQLFLHSGGSSGLFAYREVF